MPLTAIRSASDLFWRSLRSREPALLVLHSNDCKHCHEYLEGAVREASEDLGMNIWTVRPEDMGPNLSTAFPRAFQGVPQTAYVFQGTISNATLIGPHGTHDLVMAPHLLPVLSGPVPDLAAFAASIGVPYRNSIGPITRSEDRAVATSPAGAYSVPAEGTIATFGTMETADSLPLFEQAGHHPPQWGSLEFSSPLPVARVGGGGGGAKSKAARSGAASGAGAGGDLVGDVSGYPLPDGGDDVSPESVRTASTVVQK